MVITYLSNILVPYSADLLDIGSTLGNVLEIVAQQVELVFDVLGALNIDTRVHDNPTNDLLAQKVSTTI